MAIETLRNITKDPSDNLIIYRYLNREKFEYILLGKLFLSRVDSFQKDIDGDEMEPLYNYNDINGLAEFLYQWHCENNKIESDEERAELKKRCFARAKENCEYLDSTKKYTYIACFSHECKLRKPWEEYIELDKTTLKYKPEDFGVAIKTTTTKLKKAVSKFNDRLYLSHLYYVDTVNGSVMGAWMNTSGCYLSKPKKFSWEKEIRLLYQDGDKMHAKDFDNHTDIEISISINEFIDEVILSPFNSEEQNKAAIKLCNNFGLKYSIQKIVLSFQDQRKLRLI